MTQNEDVFKNLWSEFEEYLYSINAAESTIQQYQYVVYEYLNNADVNEPFSEKSVRRYLASKKIKGCVGNTLRTRYYILSSFYRALGHQFPLDKRDVPKPSQKRKIVYTLEERELMEQNAKNMGLRYYAMIRLVNTLYLRRFEYSHKITIQDYQRPYLMVRPAKGGIPVKRLLDETTCDVLERWIEERKINHGALPGDPIFVRGNTNVQLSLRGMTFIFRRIAEGAGVYKKGGGFHASRRGGVTELMEKGMQPDEVTRIMGWKSKSTVHEYNVISQRRAEKRFAEVHPNFQLPVETRDRAALLQSVNKTMSIQERTDTVREAMEGLTPAEKMELLYGGKKKDTPSPPTDAPDK